MTRIGGIAALIAGATYFIGFALFFTLLSGSADMGTAEYVGFLVDNQPIMYLWTTTIYVVNGAALVVLALALHEQFRPRFPRLSSTAAAFGLIWAGLVIASGMLRLTDLGLITTMHATDPAAAADLWPALAAVEEGLGGGVEVPGGIWAILVSFAALRTNAFPRWIAIVGIVAGGAGILTLVPGVEEFEAIFGLGLMTWFFDAGIVMVRGRRAALAPTAGPEATPQMTHA
jgi:hypothetical protein